MSSVKTLVITGFGLNCEKETSKAFEAAGSQVSRIHLNDLLESPEKLSEFHILAFIGGFSFGDHLGAGTVFANRVKFGLKYQLEKFIKSGKLIIGICNGFQTITRMGIVPAIDGLFEQEVALQHNDSGVFRDSWVTLKVNEASPCVFTKGMKLVPVPIRHGEGKFMPLNEEVLKTLEEGGYVAVRYADPVSGEQTSEFPLNPNCWDL
jgi:phosphoribosylformylglycinamidine synthase subunit PurQ / glutaminase